MPQITVDQAISIAFQHHQAGRFAEAEGLCRGILAVEPNHGDALHLLGVLAAQAGKLDAAIELIGRAITRNPTVAEYYVNLGSALRGNGKLEEAAHACRQALGLAPNSANALNNLALALRDLGKVDEAIAAYHHALKIAADAPSIHFNLGIALAQTGNVDGAIAAYRKALELKPNYPQACINLGICLMEKGQLEEALIIARRAVQFSVDAETCGNLGNTLEKNGRLDEAIEVFHQAVRLKGDIPEIHYNLGIALTKKGRLSEAADAYLRAIELKPDFAEAFNNLGDVRKDQRLLDEALACYDRAMALKPDDPKFHSNRIYTLHFLPDSDRASIYAEHRRWNERHAVALKPASAQWKSLFTNNDRDPTRRLKIGYVSPDFRAHPVARFLLPLLEQHDRGGFEVFCYSGVRFPDSMTERVRAHSDAWRNIAADSDEEVAQLIRKDQIDILVDLSMHTDKHRLLVFARKPAPVQVTYLAYCSTTGMDAIDYRFTDPYLDPLDAAQGGPPGIGDEYYSEKSVRLPETYWCYARDTEAPPVGPLPALAGGRITFGCLNNFSKVSSAAFSAWCRILVDVPDSRLLLHAKEGSHRQVVLDTMQQHGVDSNRVSFVGAVPGPDYFNLYNKIDIALDPYPYAGGTTTCDALWMGVPVVTLAGKIAVARAGVSILSNVGLPELIAQSQAPYVRLACELALDLPRLTELRNGLRNRMALSPLTDARRFARNVETAYREMWRRWLNRDTGVLPVRDSSQVGSPKD